MFRVLNLFKGCGGVGFVNVVWLFGKVYMEEGCVGFKLVRKRVEESFKG